MPSGIINEVSESDSCSGSLVLLSSFLASELVLSDVSDFFELSETFDVFETDSETFDDVSGLFSGVLLTAAVQAHNINDSIIAVIMCIVCFIIVHPDR